MDHYQRLSSLPLSTRRPQITFIDILEYDIDRNVIYTACLDKLVLESMYQIWGLRQYVALSHTTEWLGGKITRCVFTIIALLHFLSQKTEYDLFRRTVVSKSKETPHIQQIYLFGLMRLLW